METNLHPVGTYTFTADAYLSDFRGKATLPVLGGFMLQAATKHAAERGFGYFSMAAMGRIWVLSRMNIVIDAYPGNDTQITIRTWIEDINKLFTERCFSLENESGVQFGSVRSLWAALDLETRRPTDLRSLEGLSHYLTHENCPAGPAGKIAPFKREGLLADTFSVKYSDIDINKHLNSMKYIEHLTDVFPIGLYETAEISRFAINYASEAHHGEIIEVFLTEEVDGLFGLEMKTQGRTACTAQAQWRTTEN